MVAGHCARLSVEEGGTPGIVPDDFPGAVDAEEQLVMALLDESARRGGQGVPCETNYQRRGAQKSAGEQAGGSC